MPHPILMRKLRGGGKPFVPYELPGWDGVHETFQDYSEKTVAVGGGSKLKYGVGWDGPPIILTASFAGPVARTYVEDADGYTNGVSIAGVNPTGGGFAGAWEVD